LHHTKRPCHWHLAVEIARLPMPMALMLTFESGWQGKGRNRRMDGWMYLFSVNLYLWAFPLVRKFFCYLYSSKENLRVDTRHNWPQLCQAKYTVNEDYIEGLNLNLNDLCFYLFYTELRTFIKSFKINLFQEANKLHL
jgi:hypothetical protein